MRQWSTSEIMADLTAAGFSERQADAVCRVAAQVRESVRSERAKTVEAELQAKVRRAKENVQFWKLSAFALQTASAVVIAATLAIMLR